MKEFEPQDQPQGFEPVPPVHDLLSAATDAAERAINGCKRIMKALTGNPPLALEPEGPVTTHAKTQLLYDRVECLLGMVRTIEHIVTFVGENPVPTPPPQPMGLNPRSR